MKITLLAFIICSISGMLEIIVFNQIIVGAFLLILALANAFNYIRLG